MNESIKRPFGAQLYTPALEDKWAEYEFLVGRLLDRATLERAIVIAGRWGVEPHEVLLANGWIKQENYIAALADFLRVPAFARGQELPRDAVLIDAVSHCPWRVGREVTENEVAGRMVLLASPGDIENFDAVDTQNWRLKRAIAGLLRWRPVLSAGAPIWTWQLLALAILVGVVLGAAIIEPNLVLRAVAVLLTLLFLPIIVLRLVITAMGLLQTAPRETSRIPDAELPVYSILVPMFREGQVLPDLVAALSALDYPAAKLDVLLVLESVDTETQAVARNLELPGFMRVIVVPDSQPRTKPKALNYALQFARGDYVVVFDAEDVPEPDQLRQAIAMFRSSAKDTICLQGRLNIHNARESWLTRQFALEYSALFDITLPGLAWLGLPVPLGGTSNHFPRKVLDQWLGWDPFNVTEDADLGIRLARSGGHIRILPSTTWEEAPARFGGWLRQRTRWLKGWMQTYLVHTRQPARLFYELGLARFIGFHLYSGGLILSALIFPIFCAIAAYEIWQGDWLRSSGSILSGIFLGFAGFNLIGAYVATLVPAVVAVWRRRRKWLVLSALFMPLYWLLVSLAAYRALVQLITAPHFWEKTEHRARSRTRR